MLRNVGGEGRKSGDWTGRAGTPPRFTLSLLRCCYLNTYRPPPSATFFHNNQPITTTVPIHSPQQSASQVQIYSTSASPRHLNTPISVRRHLCRPSLPMSIENLKSYGQSSSSTAESLCTQDMPPPHDALPVIEQQTSILRRTHRSSLVLSATSTVEIPQPWDRPRRRSSSHFPAFGLVISLSLQTSKLTSALADPFAEADEDTGEQSKAPDYIHIRIQRTCIPDRLPPKEKKTWLIALTCNHDASYRSPDCACHSFAQSTGHLLTILVQQSEMDVRP